MRSVAANAAGGAASDVATARGLSSGAQEKGVGEAVSRARGGMQGTAARDAVIDVESRQGQNQAGGGLLSSVFGGGSSRVASATRKDASASGSGIGTVGTSDSGAAGAMAGRPGGVSTPGAKAGADGSGDAAGVGMARGTSGGAHSVSIEPLADTARHGSGEVLRGAVAETRAAAGAAPTAAEGAAQSIVESAAPPAASSAWRTVAAATRATLRQSSERHMDAVHKELEAKNVQLESGSHHAALERGRLQRIDTFNKSLKQLFQSHWDSVVLDALPKELHAPEETSAPLQAPPAASLHGSLQALFQSYFAHLFDLYLYYAKVCNATRRNATRCVRGATRCDAMRRDAARCDATRRDAMRRVRDAARCDAMRRDAMRRDATRAWVSRWGGGESRPPSVVGRRAITATERGGAKTNHGQRAWWGEGQGESRPASVAS